MAIILNGGPWGLCLHMQGYLMADNLTAVSINGGQC